MGALIFSCPRALPLMPYIPPHLHNALLRPLAAVSKAKVGRKGQGSDCGPPGASGADSYRTVMSAGQDASDCSGSGG